MADAFECSFCGDFYEQSEMGEKWVRAEGTSGSVKKSEVVEQFELCYGCAYDLEIFITEVMEADNGYDN